MALVSIRKCGNYDFEIVYEAIKASLEEIQIREIVKNKKVLLKPNLLAPNKPEDAVTTHPVIVKAVIRLLKEYGADKIYVGDSPGIGAQEIIYGITGIKKVVEEEGAEIADFKEKIEIKNPEGKLIKKFVLAKAFSDADIIVSLPKLKTHGMTYYTGAVKNLFGLVPGVLKPKFHYQFPDKSDFSNMLVDLNIAVKPSFTIMDGILAMEGNGPRGGNPVVTGVIIAGRDLFAVDSVACAVVGINPYEIGPLAEGAKRGIGEINIEKIEIIGEPLERVKVKGFKQVSREKSITGLIPLPKALKDFIRALAVPKPYFNHSKCVMCGECVKVCPSEPKSLTIVKKRIHIERKNCIRCFCCQEMCPVSAIKPKIFVR